MKTRFYLAFLLAGSTAAFGQAPKTTQYFSWHQKNQSILSPGFSHSDSELVFVRRFQVPDGNAVAGHKAYTNSRRLAGRP